jgi:cell division protein FtsI/penicillin-binding protein 2
MPNKFKLKPHSKNKFPIGRWLLLAFVGYFSWNFLGSDPETKTAEKDNSSSSEVVAEVKKIVHSGASSLLQGSSATKKSSSSLARPKTAILQQKVNTYLKRYKPQNAAYLLVDAHSNKILAHGQWADSSLQQDGSYFPRSTFPAASLAKIITAAAALESDDYTASSKIPQIGRYHTLYKRQLKVPKHYKGPTVSLKRAFASSINPAMGVIGQKLGGGALEKTSRKLGFNVNFKDSIIQKSNFTPPDSGYALAEVACGFTQETTISPLLAAAISRSIQQEKALELPYLPLSQKGNFLAKPGNLEISPLKGNTYKDLQKLMKATYTSGTARTSLKKEVFSQYRSKINIGGKTGTLDGKSPKGRYDWFLGYAENKLDKNNAVIIVVMQVHGKLRTLKSTSITGLLINDWAKNYLRILKK